MTEIVKLAEVLLVDDHPADNFYNELIFNRVGCAEKISVCLNVQEALDYLTTPVDGRLPKVELICLDINMPVMNGWEFLERYERLPPENRAHVVLMMLTTSLNPDDRSTAEQCETINGFASKPLSEAMLRQLLEQYFPGRFVDPNGG